jgi:hypothetical protein
MIHRIKNYIAICLFAGLFFVNTINDVIAIGKDDTLREESQKFEVTKWYEYEPAIVTLKGTVILLNDYGPPNYGENPKTDEKVRYYTLQLDKPINVKADPKSDVNTDSFLNECLLQLVILSDNIEILRAKLDKKVIVTGTLYQRFTGHHYTNVLIKVKKTELAEEKDK